MRKLLLSAVSIALLFQLSAQPAYKNPQASTEERVADLLSRMTVKEKVGQLCSPLGWEMYKKKWGKRNSFRCFRETDG